MTRKSALRILLALLLAAGIAVAVVYRDAFDVAALESRIDEMGMLAPIAFMALYALAAVFFLPGSVFTLAGGALFGPVLGTFYNLTGATIGAVLAFIASRYLASDWVAERAGGRVRQLIDGVETEGWRFVAFVRLVPLFPFNLLNYALGLTKIRLRDYTLATYLFMLPGAVAYTWIGFAGREALGGGEGLVRNILIAIALLAAVAFLPRLVGAMRRGRPIDIGELRERLDDDAILLLDVRAADACNGEQGRIESAVHIDANELPDRLDELAEHTGRPIAVLGADGKDSADAAALLARSGFHDVHPVRGGMQRWRQAGRTVTKPRS